MHTELHWLDVPERIQYKLGVLMYWCQHNQVTQYLTNNCTPVSNTTPPASAFSQQPSSLRSTPSSQNVLLLGFFCCWSDGLSLTTWRHVGSAECSLNSNVLQTATEDTYFWSTVCSANQHINENVRQENLAQENARKVSIESKETNYVTRIWLRRSKCSIHFLNKFVVRS